MKATVGCLIFTSVVVVSIALSAVALHSLSKSNTVKELIETKRRSSLLISTPQQFSDVLYTVISRKSCDIKYNVGSGLCSPQDNGSITLGGSISKVGWKHF